MLHSLTPIREPRLRNELISVVANVIYKANGGFRVMTMAQDNDRGKHQIQPVCSSRKEDVSAAHLIPGDSPCVLSNSNSKPLDLS